MEEFKQPSEMMEEYEKKNREKHGPRVLEKTRFRPYSPPGCMKAIFHDMLSGMCCGCLHGKPVEGGHCERITNARLNCEDKDRLYKFFDAENRK